ncbi:trigger factor [Salipiger aestuarii]|uniref:DUF6314 family protein n=1 Tax=Salipiger aestuarii TaxID=568098 RepID=UPI00025B4651|nr:DUF6314 family protein [Salipiger aestuarii]EIE52318.1 hypothetical protein C357_04822 [Citreicella sp. 357]KAA8609032.1 trigger factor [Salipiger aestuarii]
MRGLEAFFGDWQLTREIREASGGVGRFTGLARWQPDGDGALYVETGDLVLATGRFAATRCYRWGRDLSVWFEDGRFFHTVPAEGGDTGHWCDPDQYDVSYDFSRWPEWQVRWQVKGPRKDYVMVSRYARGEAK